MKVAHAVVDADGSRPGHKVLGEVLGRFPALEIHRQMQGNADWINVSKEIHTPLGQLEVDLVV